MLDKAEACLLEAQQCFERIGERQGMAYILDVWSAIALSRGDFTGAEEFSLASLALRREIDVDPRYSAVVINTLGEVARARGDFAEAVSYYQNCLALNPDNQWAEHNLGHAFLRQGGVGEAEARFRQSVTIARRWGNPMILASTIGGFAGISAACHQPRRAARLFGAASTLLEQCGGVLEGADQADWDHHLAAARAQLDDATWEAAWAEGAAMTEDEAVAYARGEIDPWGMGVAG